jgi:hypothetical protein
MNPEGATPASLGFGVERYIAKSRAARDASEKIEHLTCAIEALLLHLSSLEGDARQARGATAQPSESAEGQTADAGRTAS